MIAAAIAALDSLGDVDEGTRERLVRWLRTSDRIDLDSHLLGLHIGVDTQYAERIAAALANEDVFTQRDVMVCSNPGCGVALGPESLQEERCRSCNADLAEQEPRREVRYLLERPRSHDVGWLVALHGIRTRGTWQEELQWLIDRQFLRTVPFRNWKYGRVLLQALVPPLQRRVVRRFREDLAQAASDLRGVLRSGEAPAPDVVAHSFGTWILANALRADPSLKVGHVVLVGSIVPPDWDWAALLNSDQVATVLNYCGDKDPWVRLTERVVPGSGPSGVVGFIGQDDRLMNVLLPGGSHSSVFAQAQLPTTFEDVWGPFLANRVADIDMKGHRVIQLDLWRKAPAILRAPFLAVGVFFGALGAVVVTLLLH